MIATALSVADEEIKAVASMASLALALLAFFTNLRRDALNDYLAEVDPFDLRTLIDALPDILLALFTGAAVIAMAPLFCDSFSLSAVGTRSGAVSSMFGLIWLGFVCLFLFQLSTVGRRLYGAITA